MLFDAFIFILQSFNITSTPSAWQACSPESCSPESCCPKSCSLKSCSPKSCSLMSHISHLISHISHLTSQISHQTTQIYISPSHSNANASRNFRFRGCVNGHIANILLVFSNNRDCVGYQIAVNNS